MDINSLVPINNFSLNPIITAAGINGYLTNGVILVNLFKCGLYYRDNIYITKFYLWIPSGIRTNFASVPWTARWLVSPTTGSLVIPATIHDYITGEFDLDTNFVAVEINDEIYVVKKSSVNQFITWYAAYKNALVSIDSSIELPKVDMNWKLSAVLFRNIGKTFTGKYTRFQTSLAYYAVSLYGKFKRYH